MAVFQLKFTQDLQADKDIIWDFISKPSNLKEITPDYMGFDIRTEVPKRMYPGLIIAYTVRPLLGIPTTWVTEITHVDEGNYFVDEQRHGPYAMWHHEHHLEAIEGGVRMHDIITYRPPMGIIGAWANRWLIKPKLNEIFSYRRRVLKERYGEIQS